VQQMIADGASSFTEVGPGNVLIGLVGKINKEVSVLSI
jgi:[acyl-carrier-protein] S-malonyltransferase